MSTIDDVKAFAREYVNHSKHRTPERKEKIREAYFELFKRKLGKSCATCYIEAVFKIIKFKPMASPKYELKKGVVLQAFGHPEKTCTNNTITDELGDWYMEHFPEKVVFFVRYPRPIAPVIPGKMKIVKPVENPVENPVETPQNLVTKTIVEMTNPPVKKSRKKPSKT